MKYSQCARGASEVLRPLFRTAPLRRVCALLALWLVTVFGAPGQVRPYIGFVYPAGGQQGATFRVRLGGQALDGVQAVLVTGSGVRAKVAIRINPDVEAGGHSKISTGGSATKFGVSLNEAQSLYARANAAPALETRGLACHIGSQITELAPLRTAYVIMRDLTTRLRRQGLAVDSLDLGGGLGVPYFLQPDPPPPHALAAMAADTLGDLGLQVIFEPGRAIAANAGILLSSVVRVNVRAGGRKFVVLDAGMNDLLRPAMYDAFHDIRPVTPRHGPKIVYDVVGPVCESGDTFARDRALDPLAGGDLVAFMTAGAYGAAMASEYNSRPLVPEVLVRKDAFASVRIRPTYEEMLAAEKAAPWL